MKKLPGGIEIRAATEAADVNVLRTLFQEYQDAVGVDLCFQNFASELASLPGKYAPPHGRLFLAEAESEPAGCAALRRIDDATCEMKRLYVRSRYRSTGLGRRLAEEVIRAAHDIGYLRIVLDTLPSMAAAQRLYESPGFADIAPYAPNPIAGTRYMSLSL
jgi:ribosomal protein S18 acetylase RimI-like enzyme